MEKTARTRNLSAAGSAVLRGELTRAIKQAALHEFAASGYGGFSMEAVAKRAGVGKAALYRRWPGKDAMIVEVLSEGGLQFAEAPDTGSLRDDLIGYLRNAIAILKQPLNARIAAHLYAEMNNNSPFGRLIRARIQPVKHELAGRILERAVARGELDQGTDVDLALDVLNGALYWRLVVARGETSDRYFQRLVSFLLAGFGAKSAGMNRPKASA